MRALVLDPWDLLTTIEVDPPIVSKSYRFTLRQALNYDPWKPTVHQLMGVERDNVRKDLKAAAAAAGVAWK